MRGFRSGSAMECGPIVLAHEPDFRIGTVTVRPSARELITEAGRVVLEPRVMQMLVALNRADGAVVTKDDLIRLCWNGRIVGEDAINRVVSRLRQTARQDAGGQFRVETITRVGYRLAGAAPVSDQPENVPLAPTMAAGEQVLSSDAPATRTPMMARSRMRRAVLIGGGAALLTGASILTIDLTRGETLIGEARVLADEASRLFLLGTSEHDASAVGMLRRAASLQPESATVWGLLAIGYMRMLRSPAPVADRASFRQRGEAAARRALELDPEQPDAQAALLSVLPLYRNWLAFDRASSRPYRRHPDNLELCMLHARLLAQVGRFGEILAPSEVAVRKAPVHPGVQLYYAMTLIQLGRLEEGERQLDHCFDLWPRRMDVFFVRLNHLFYNNRPEEALASLRQSGSLPVGFDARDRALAEAKGRAIAGNRSDEVRAALDLLEASARTGTWLAEDAVMFAVNRGDLDRAFRILEALYFNRGFSVANSVQSSAGGGERNTYFLFWRVLQPLRRDPRFAALTRAIGLDDYWRQSRSRHLVVA